MEIDLNVRIIPGRDFACHAQPMSVHWVRAEITVFYSNQGLWLVTPSRDISNTWKSRTGLVACVFKTILVGDEVKILIWKCEQVREITSLVTLPYTGNWKQVEMFRNLFMGSHLGKTWTSESWLDFYRCQDFEFCIHINPLWHFCTVSLCCSLSMPDPKTLKHSRIWTQHVGGSSVSGLGIVN